MQLSVLERMALDGALPKEGNYLTMLLVNDLKKCIGITPELVKELNIRQAPGGGIQWDREKEQSLEVDIGEATMTIVKKALAGADKAGKLTVDHCSLYKKFMEPKPQGGSSGE